MFTRFEAGQSWAILSPIEQSIKRKIEAAGRPLKDWDIRINYGIKTGCNEAFIIDGAKKDELIAQDPKSAEIIRPILRGRDIKRYGYDFHDTWLILTHNGLKEKNIPPVDVTEYPAIKAHLDQYYQQLARRLDKGVTPYNLRNCAYMNDFNKQKIIYQELCRTGCAFALDDKKYMIANTAYFLVIDNNGKNKITYLLDFLNSPIALYQLDNICSKFDETGWRWLCQFVEQIRIPINIKKWRDEFDLTFDENNFIISKYRKFFLT